MPTFHLSTDSTYQFLKFYRQIFLGLRNLYLNICFTFWFQMILWFLFSKFSPCSPLLLVRCSSNYIFSFWIKLDTSYNINVSLFCSTYGTVYRSLHWFPFLYLPVSGFSYQSFLLIFYCHITATFSNFIKVQRVFSLLVTAPYVFGILYRIGT